MRLLNLARVLAATTTALLAGSPACAADYLFNFSGNGFFGGTLNGTGVLTTDGVSTINPLNGYTVQTITGLTGTFNGSTITGLAPGLFGANNLYYLTGPFFVDGNGLGFATAAGISANLFVTSDTSYRVNTQGAGLLTGLVSAQSSQAAAAVPEPSTWALMLFGFGAIGYALRRTSRRVTIQLARI